MADAAPQDTNPVFNIQRMYLKDLSLEQPNSPQILLDQQQSQRRHQPGHLCRDGGRRHL